MSEHLCIRFTGDMLPVGMFAYLREHGLLLLVKEKGSNGDNPHFQGILQANMNTVRCYLKKHVPGGNAVWSLKKCPTPGDFAKYLSKEIKTGGEVIYNEGYDMDALNLEWHETAAQIAAKSKKRKHENVTDAIYEDIKEDIGETLDGRTIASSILRWHITNGKRVPNSFNMQTLTMTYVCRQNETYEGVDKLSDIELVARLYPQINF